ncbi:hypothetical protein GB931_02910 [Modestobacter sp. I12A-02628]|uniref:Alkylmercury lyase n=1 Tax=Goekera deserti TaxID=2497753 RepID=A0A7K3WD13_9ACTN|nr:organomercurial lyase [Goekera deserti]MPQ96888.1 hypothetical protein [Goekera deserti]NDI46799.1 hypothetical protein [Goekera deserti]NEL54368.1 hypothetical protein [Goekera deserti]
MNDAREVAETTCTIPLPRLTKTQDALLRAAFRELMTTSAAVGVERLANLSGVAAVEVEEELAQLAAAGRVGRDRNGSVTGALGLTIDTTRHELLIGSTSWHTWCVIDALGILGALSETGTVRSTVPATDESVEVQFTDGHPTAGALDSVVFMPDHQAGAPVIDSWCPSVNFFPDADAAERWAAGAGVRGRQVSLPVATAAASDRWRERLAE